ncbi:MAG: transporter substrate-binding domain-containing protein, partial [Aquiluna sp.]
MTTISKKFGRSAVASIAGIALALGLSACAPAEEAAVEEVETTPTSEEVTEDVLETLTAGKLTIGTGLPAYYPWVLDDTPESGEGFESAVAYAVAAELGFAPEDVVWVRTTFEEAIQPGPKSFDFNLQQYSITEERKASVDFSSPYYYTAQTVITVAGSAAEGVTDLADLKDLLIGAQTGTTSLKAIEEIIQPN